MDKRVGTLTSLVVMGLVIMLNLRLDYEITTNISYSIFNME